LRRVGWLQLDNVPVDEELAGILEVDGDAMADHRLDLAQPPVGTAGMAHEVAGREQRIARLFKQVFVTLPYEYDSRRVRGRTANLAYMTQCVTPTRRPE
jgi:hypothetical protein